MMRNRALVVRAISAWRRRGKGPMEECAASLRRRSSTQVSAQSSTARIMLMSSCRVPSSLIRFASRAALGAPCLERVTPVATTAHREVPAGVVSKICGAAGSPTVSRYCGDVSGLSQTVRCLELELQIFSLKGERQRDERASRCNGPAIADFKRRCIRSRRCGKTPSALTRRNINLAASRIAKLLQMNDD